MTDPSESDAQADDSPGPDPGPQPDQEAAEAENYASVVQVERHDDVATICGRIDTAPSYAVVVHAPGGNRTLSSEIGMRRVVRHAEETGRIIAFATSSPSLSSRARQLAIPVARKPEYVRWDAGGRVIWRFPGYSLAVPAFGRVFQVLVIVGIAVLFVAALLTVGPSATVIAYPPSETLETTVTLTVSETFESVDVENLQVPAVLVSSSRTVTLVIPTTGAAFVPTTRATAMALLENDTAQDITIPQGTFLDATDGGTVVGFVTDQEVTVEAGEEEVVDITARLAGEAGNIPGDTELEFTASEFALVSVVIEEAATGGASEGRPAIDAEDIVTLRETADLLVGSRAIEDTIIADRPRDVILLDSASVEIERGDPSGNPGVMADVVTMDVRVAVTALAIPEWAWDEIAPSILAPGESGREFIRGTVVATPADSPATVIDGATTIEFLVRGEFAQDATSSEIADAVKGRSPEDARSVLETRYGIEQAEVDLSPGWAPRLPRFGFRIDVELRSRPNDDTETTSQSAAAPGSITAAARP